MDLCRFANVRSACYTIMDMGKTTKKWNKNNGTAALKKSLALKGSNQK
jgi:hypothetical protein